MFRIRIRVEQKTKPRGAVVVRMELGGQRQARAAKRSVLRGTLWCGPEVGVLVPDGSGN